MFPRLVLKVCYLALSFTVGVVLFFYNENLQEEIRLLTQAPLSKKEISASGLIGTTVPDFRFQDISGQIRSFSSIPQKLVLVVLFSPYDCPPCLSEAPVWEDIYKMHNSDKFSVFTFADERATRDDVDLFIKEHNLTLPIVHDDKGILRKSLNIPATPIRVLISMHPKREILDASISTPVKKKQSQFKDLVAKLISETL